MSERPPGVPPDEGPRLGPEERRWLHETYRTLDHNEAELANYRTSFIAVVTTALVAAFVYAVANVLPHGDLLFATAVSFLAVFGIFLSAFWALVLWRTTEAQNLWRQAARELEERSPPVAGSLVAPILVRPGSSVAIDLARPYTAHARRFSASGGIPWVDRVSPARLTNALPVVLIVTWVGVLVGVWVLVLLNGP